MEEKCFNQVLSCMILLKRSSPLPNVGMGPEIKTVLSQADKNSKRSIKSNLVSSDCLRAVSLVPTCTMIFVIVGGAA